MEWCGGEGKGQINDFCQSLGVRSSRRGEHRSLATSYQSGIIQLCPNSDLGLNELFGFFFNCDKMYIT